jgi:hypothetical protein
LKICKARANESAILFIYATAYLKRTYEKQIADSRPAKIRPKRNNSATLTVCMVATGKKVVYEVQNTIAA